MEALGMFAVVATHVIARSAAGLGELVHSPTTVGARRAASRRDA